MQPYIYDKIMMIRISFSWLKPDSRLKCSQLWTFFTWNECGSLNSDRSFKKYISAIRLVDYEVLNGSTNSECLCCFIDESSCQLL